jgi:hypothetical protein
MIRRVLAIRPMGPGFGFALLEGSARLLDWGIRGRESREMERNLRDIRRLLAHYHPETLVIEDLRGGGRSPRAHALAEALIDLAKDAGVKVRRVSKRAARRNLDDKAPVKQFRLARMIAGRFPELAGRLPPHRRPWMGQDFRYAIFEAVALGLAVYRSIEPPPDEGDAEEGINEGINEDI